MCLVCARDFPYRDKESAQEIHWKQPFADGKKFFNCNDEETEKLYGLDTYLEKYGKDPLGYYDLGLHRHEFDDWYLDVSFPNRKTRILCCPEDKTCANPSCMQQRQLCSECRAPVCTYCYDKYLNSLSPSLPPSALSNDMMVFYAPEELYQDGGLTIMEMLCASPCLTAMICFSMEVKYGNMLNSHALMQRHRVGGEAMQPHSCYLGKV